MRCKVGRHFEFEASHSLPEEGIYGKCSNLHGHRYELEVEVEGQIQKEGWVCNFTEIKQIVNDAIIEKFDHAHLNDFFEIPTVENMARYIFDELSKLFGENEYELSKIRLYETSKCYAEICR
ncbi:MAG: 6-carboxytetrahydropterin synthase QueD [Clostridiales bacterium]|nr:6-carboxytetrahydropterin synthase QueD [Clostridiales bacterium]